MTDSRLERWVGIVAGLLAPLGLVTALLFYFGYRSSQAQYAFYGIDVNTIGMGTADFVMRSPQPLLIPLVALAVVAIPIIAVHSMLRRALNVNSPGAPTNGNRIRRLTWLFVGIAVVGAVLLFASFTMTVFYPVFRNWSSASFLDSLGYLFGAALALYGSYMAVLARRGDVSRGDIWRSLTGAQHAMIALLVLVIVGSLFWATSILAGMIGRGTAGVISEQFGDLPSVILDTKERLYLRHPSVIETVLPKETGQVFRYRYRQLRLLVEGSDRMFLVPEKWTNGGTSIVVPLDGSVRVQFLFINPG